MLSFRHHRRFCLISALVIALTLSLIPPARAQSDAPSSPHPASATQPTAALSGTVVDPTGAVIPGASLTLTRSGPNATPVTATSDGQGNFTLPALAPGTYTVAASALGFRPIRLERVALQPGQTRRLTLTLVIQMQQQQVTVNANAIDSSPDKNGDAIIFKGSDLDALSDDPDELTEELQAIAGSDPDAGTQFYIDGFSGGRLPPKSAIREIRMNQNPYSAQYDQIGFGRVEIFTKPGADTWHGDFFTQDNDSSLNSRNPFVTTQPPYHSIELWGDLNGPVTKNSSQFTELWRQSSSDDSIVNAFVLDSSFNPTPFTQIFPDTTSDTDFSTRYDLQAGKVQTLSLRYHLSRWEQTNAGVGQFALVSQAHNTDDTEQSLRFSDSQLYGPNLLNETRFQYIRDRDRTTPQTFGPTIVVQGGFTGGGSNLGLNNDAQDHYELQNYAQTTRGKHTIDFGTRLRDTRDSNTSTANFNGQYIFPSLTAYQITEQGMANGSTPAQIAAAGGGPSLFSQTTGKPAIVVSVFDIGLYAEDNYKIKPNVTLTGGLRFESQTGMPDHGDFAPRLGASWALNRPNNKPPLAVIRSGFGLFYQRFPSLNVLQAQRQNGVTEQEQIVTGPTFYPAVCSSDPTACSGASSTVAPTIFRIGPVLRAPYIMMASIGVDRPIGHIGQVSANYQFSHGVHLFLTRNINAPLPGTFNPADPTSGIRPNGTDQNIYEYESEGDNVRHLFRLSANLHTQFLGIFSNYQLGKADADTSGIGGFPSNGYDLHQDWGRASNDYRQRLFFGGWVHIHGGFSLNPFLIYQSSAPFNIVTGQDLNGDNQYNDRPTFATDLTRPSVVHTQWGTFDTAPIAGQTTVPINYGKGPDTFVLNMRGTKTFNFGPPLPQETPAPPPPGSKATASKAPKKPIERKYNLGFSVQAQNVLNHVNLAPPVGVLGSPLFGESTALASNFGTGSANRTLNLGASFRF